jgi:hypothetical protein
MEKMFFSKSTIQNIFIQTLTEIRNNSTEVEIIKASVKDNEHGNFLQGDANIQIESTGVSLQSIVDLVSDFWGVQQKKISLDVIDSQSRVEVRVNVGSFTDRVSQETPNNEEASLVVQDLVIESAERIYAASDSTSSANSALEIIQN